MKIGIVHLECPNAVVRWCETMPVAGRSFTIVAVLLAVSVLAACSAAQAQDDPSIQPKANPTAEQPDATLAEPITDPLQLLRQRISRLVPQIGEADVDDATREQIRGLLTQATADTEAAIELAKQNSALQQQLKKLPDEANDAGKPPPPPGGKPIESMTAEELEVEWATVRLGLTSAEHELNKRQETAENSADRKRSLQEKEKTAKESVTAADDRLQKIPENSGTLLGNALRAEAEASQFRAVVENELAVNLLAKLDFELQLNLPSMLVEKQQKLIRLHQDRLKTLQETLASLRQNQARQALKKAELAEDQLDTITNVEIKKLGELRIELAIENERITKQDMPHWQKILERRKEELQRLEDKGDQIRDRVMEFGTDKTLGEKILDFGRSLPSLREIGAEIGKIETLTAEWRTLDTEYEDAKKELAAATEDFRETASEAESDILDSLPEVLDQVNQNRTQLFLRLAEVNGADRETIGFIEDWMQFSSEHLLWLRSHYPLTRADLDAVKSTERVDGRRIQESLRTIANSAGASLWALLIPAGLAIVILLAVQSRAKDALMRRGEEAQRKTCVSLQPTIWAMLLSVGLAAEWPLGFMLAGTWLQLNNSEMTTAVGHAMIQLGAVALWLNFFRQVLRAGGLASNHLMWNRTVCDRLRRWLHLVFYVAALPMFSFLLARNISNHPDSLERLLFLLLLACSSALLCQLFFPVSGPFVRTLVGRSRILHSTRFIWIAGIVAAPLILAVCSATGFHHTALSLWDRMLWTVVTGTAVILCWSLVLRWLRMNHRATRLALARERAQQRDQSEEPKDASLPQQTVTDDSELLVFGTQARLLIRNAAILMMIGCTWAIWFDILPSLRIVDRYELWTVQEQVSVQTSEAGEESTKQIFQSRAVTIGSLFMVAFAAAATFVGVRQLPGLIGMILMRQSSVDSGVRYTITTVVRYMVLIAGTIVVTHSLGLRWSQVQWLVAGLSVGLGFGLQEVFANFVSGIIILVERPIRIGDVVTIDGVSGVVSKIQIRATSITDWDRREYIVPNRDLVTGKLLNWTLSDSTNRVVIPVGISYG
ncbi:MAG: mechanosensitive ion channel domain-containing protein, partial [Planctomycetaceae bacterium]